ncbi:MAG: SDR family oxidoreductase [Dehalococcoidia bacterium]|nr:MAG: SDR family oxidoreductase [Dehalococcoidia bacterium]
MTTQTIAQLFDLTGKGAIVTGAAMGIGQAIASRLAEAGAGVMITDINPEAASQTVEQIMARGGKARAIHADATSADDANKAVEATVESFGRLDILVNNAGIYPFSPILEISEEMWNKVLDINLKGVYSYSQAAAREMVRAGHGGKIVNIASMEGLHPREQLAAYVASKGGMIMLTKAMALELATHNILINAIAPGGVWTPGTEALARQTEASGIPLEGAMDTYMARVPLGRFAEPDDVAKVVLFLASAAADYMTGSVLLVDGGFQLS